MAEPRPPDMTRPSRLPLPAATPLRQGGAPVARRKGSWGAQPFAQPPTCRLQRPGEEGLWARPLVFGFGKLLVVCPEALISQVFSVLLK